MHVTTAGERNRASGTIGRATRDSTVRKQAQASAATASAASTEGARKPWAPPDITPKVSAASARTAVTWPSGSSGAASRGDLGVRTASSASTAAPTGRLTKKTDRQPAADVRMPPSTGPAAMAAAPPELQTATARARAA